jgi:predicted RND superfamily exporter protein
MENEFMAYEEKYKDILQNLETAIISVYRKRTDLTDYEVMEALEALISHYRAEEINKESMPPKLSEKSSRVYSEVLSMSEGRMGKESKYSELFKLSEHSSIKDIIACLKTILASVKKWNKADGRQGYLNFVNKFIV